MVNLEYLTIYSNKGVNLPKKIEQETEMVKSWKVQMENYVKHDGNQHDNEEYYCHSRSYMLLIEQI